MTSTQEITIICNAVVTCVLAITGVIGLWISYKTKAIAQNAVDLGTHNAEVGAANAEAIGAVKRQTNGMSTHLQELATKAGFAAGVKSETDKTQTGHL